MRKPFLLLFLALLPASAFAQRVNCVVFTPATVAKMNAHNIPVSTGLVEYMTATELAAAMTRALHFEIPRPQSVHDIDTAIAWRVLKFARSSEQLNRMFMAYCASYGQDTITSEVAIKWLTHNNFVAKFNAWDAADVKHNWEKFKLPQKAVGTEPSVEDHPKTASSRAIPTKTLDEAEAAHMAIIDHASPKVTAAIAKEREWIKLNINSTPARFRDELEGQYGAIKLDTTDSFSVKVLDVGRWEFKRLDSTDRDENQARTNQKVSYVCDVDYRKIDWPRVQIEEYPPSNGNPRPAYLLMTNTADSPWILCDNNFYDTIPPMRDNSPLLALLFDSEPSAKRFADRMSQHAKEMK
jgi:hypothetical protein